ncbi:MAG: methylamine utilization protein [Pirellulaceae bacterium]|nr:methylamine utilization protein [Pirellulaceae bacterium]
MDLTKCFVASAMILIVTSATAAAQQGDLKITFKLKGTRPPPQRPVIRPGAVCGAVLDETLIVHPENNGIKNVVVYVYTGRRGTQLPQQQPPKRLIQLTGRNCRLDPHVLLTQVGDTIQFVNADPIAYSINFGFFNNPPQGFVLPVGQGPRITLEVPEPAVCPIACNIHPWIQGFVLVVDHPFAAKSDDKGVLEIKGLPTGKTIIFRAWHETGTFRNQILVNGMPTNWISNKFEADIQPGMNDLGIVEIPIEDFDL